MEAEARDLTLDGTMRFDFDWVAPYPYLGTVSLSFVRMPAFDFKLSINDSPDVLALVKPLSSSLKQLLKVCAWVGHVAAIT